jgi:Tol biopolymer transport system component
MNMHPLYFSILQLVLISMIFITSCKTTVEPLATERVNVQSPSDSSIVYISSKAMMLADPDQMFVTTDYINSNLIQGYGSADNPAWSPDKQKIAYTLGSTSLWIMRHDGENAHPIASQSLIASPRWSHDGNSLAFIGILQGTRGYYLIDSSGGNLRRAADVSLIPNWALISFPYVDWCRGDSLLLTGYNQLDSPYVSSLVGILSLNSGEFSVLNNLNFLEPSQPRASPKRDEIAFIGEDNLGFNGKLYRSNMDGSNIVELCGAWECMEPCWSRDGERIMFLRRDGEALPLAIWVVNRDGSNLREIFGTEGFHIFEPDL